MHAHTHTHTHNTHTHARTHARTHTHTHTEGDAEALKDELRTAREQVLVLVKNNTTEAAFLKKNLTAAEADAASTRKEVSLSITMFIHTYARTHPPTHTHARTHTTTQKHTHTLSLAHTQHTQTHIHSGDI